MLDTILNIRMDAWMAWLMCGLMGMFGTIALEIFGVNDKLFRWIDERKRNRRGRVMTTKNTLTPEEQAKFTIATSLINQFEAVTLDLLGSDETTNAHIRGLCSVLRAYVEPYAVKIGKI